MSEKAEEVKAEDETAEETKVDSKEETNVVSKEESEEEASAEASKPESSLQTRQIIEGLLLAAGKPLPMSKIAEVFDLAERPETEELKTALKEIEADCETRGFELKKVSSGYRFQVKQAYGEWVGKLWEEKPQRYSRALLETISIIAYRQPVTRGEIEKIRGVAVSTNIIRTLMDRDWVRVVGHRDVPGRPAMYASTKSFLDYFNLKSLEELPPLAEIRDLEDLDPELSLEEDLPESRVLEFPGAGEQEDEFEVADEEEEQAAAIGTRPIEEILGIRQDEESAELEESLDEDLEDLEEEQEQQGEERQESEQGAIAPDADARQDNSEPADPGDSEAALPEAANEPETDSGEAEDEDEEYPPG